MAYRSTLQIAQIIIPTLAVFNLGREIKVSNRLNRFNHLLLDRGEIFFGTHKRRLLAALEVVVGQPLDFLAELLGGQLIDQQLLFVVSVQRRFSFTHSGFVVNEVKASLDLVHAINLPFDYSASKLKRERLFNRERFASIEKISRVQAPLLMLHGSQDDTIPIRLGERLFAAANAPKQWVRMEGASHSDLDQVDPTRYQAILQGFATRYLSGQ